MALPLMKNYVNGEWVESNSKTIGDVWNPALGEKIARVAYGTKEDVDKAVAAAKAAFWEWRTTPPLTRARYLFRLKDAFEENFEEIARVLTTEQGKCIDEARGEVRRMIENVEHATGVTTLMCGYTLEDIAKNIDCYGHRQPMGVFGAIVPYNFPGMVPWWFLPYAVVCGNTFIVKPSEQVPMTQTKIFEIVDEIGFPEGVINMVHGSRDVVNAMLDHPDIEGISFVGSTPTAKYIYERCGATGKRVQALGGAKNIVAVTPDADLAAGMPSLITSFFGCTGQRCLSGSILAPVGDVADELIEKFLFATKVMKVGNGLDEQTAMGPVVSAAHKERVLGFIEKGIEEGADLILDGRDFKVPDYPNGFFIGPTIFDNVKPDMTLACQEIFGPVVSIVRCKDLDEAIELVNTRGFANAACLYTGSGGAAREFKYRVKPSMVGINIGIAAPMSFFPFGGAGDSMFGDIKGHGQEIFHFFTDTKVVIERWF
ncbi:MAG: CoA-acylating methylmalonate-semialdehyde dehydrogenase [Deltaproteobacteria bacterium]|nr:CoA-acylating methylmalonate-semialdehyde dehydrogenase [Deltaproteobacteria bacterium]MBW1956392.1 CoA-acylating methylmalonate-semialdehyde dehydrogenase [Deltaproteobacteria bacterium]MBW2042877.1 CoA-acylating methylmalonate-semialdehyde dehydrogenase [Deltaproteobacteria bacterium]MBW2131262.1 CoA-acylating methylmalonate-semialdehyde dehydrogenase [Deltaproteobacteria bacterium]